MLEEGLQGGREAFEEDERGGAILCIDAIRSDSAAGYGRVDGRNGRECAEYGVETGDVGDCARRDLGRCDYDDGVLLRI